LKEHLCGTGAHRLLSWLGQSTLFHAGSRMSDIISYEIDVKRGLLRVRLGDGTTPELLLASMTELRADPLHDPLRPAVFDLRGMGELPAMQRMQQLAEVGKASPIHLATARALLVNAGPDFEAAHHFSLIAQRQGRYFGVFTNPEAAERWLLARKREP
jgi:hypothetical protein